MDFLSYALLLSSSFLAFQIIFSFSSAKSILFSVLNFLLIGILFISSENSLIALAQTIIFGSLSLVWLLYSQTIPYQEKNFKTFFSFPTFLNLSFATLLFSALTTLLTDESLLKLSQKTFQVSEVKQIWNLGKLIFENYIEEFLIINFLLFGSFVGITFMEGEGKK